jgi:hypothetical protein
MATSAIWLDQNSPICPVLPDALWDSQRTPPKNQTCQNVKHQKTPNVRFQINLQIPRKRTVLHRFYLHMGWLCFGSTK